MRNFRGEIGRKIRYKMLSFKRIGFHFKMTNENVRFFRHFFQGAGKFVLKRAFFVLVKLSD